MLCNIILVCYFGCFSNGVFCKYFQVVLITGASSGLGESLAHSFYKAGCRVILAARREEELERVRNDLLAEHVVRDNSSRL